MNNTKIIEFSNESCSFCKHDGKCDYKQMAMTGTREAIKGLRDCSAAYFSMKLNCDY